VEPYDRGSGRAHSLFANRRNAGCTRLQGHASEENDFSMLLQKPPRGEDPLKIASSMTWKRAFLRGQVE
jgi:hypothetical protein